MPNPVSAIAIADQFGRTGKALQSVFGQALVPHGATLSRARVLIEVARTGPARLSAVATAVGVAQGTASELADALVRDGLIVRRPDPSDRRAVLLEATAHGRERSERWGAAYAAAAEALFGALEDEQRATFLALLTALEP